MSLLLLIKKPKKSINNANRQHIIFEGFFVICYWVIFGYFVVFLKDVVLGKRRLAELFEEE